MWQCMRSVGRATGLPIVTLTQARMLKQTHSETKLYVHGEARATVPARAKHGGRPLSVKIDIDIGLGVGLGIGLHKRPLRVGPKGVSPCNKRGERRKEPQKSVVMA